MLRLGHYLLGTEASSTQGSLKPEKIKILDGNDNVLQGRTVNSEGDPNDETPNALNVDLTDPILDSNEDYVYETEEYFIENGTEPEKYKVTTEDDTEISTGVIETILPWTPLDTIKLTYKFT